MTGRHGEAARVELYWLPLGAGDSSGCVRRNGRIFEAVAAHRQRRRAADLYHSALVVRLDGASYTIEMAPAWGHREQDRGVVAEGPVGLRWLGRSRLFRYEIRRWRDGVIPDIADAVESPQNLDTDADLAGRLLDLVPAFPAVTWGRDELRAGEMWNSNSLIAWLLVRSGHQAGPIRPPTGGRAPGWSAGLTVAAKATPEPSRIPR
jgi:hypothetical protein